VIDLAPLWSFIAVSLVIIVAPGADTMLLIRNTMDSGRRAGLATFAGICLGNLILTTLVASGVGIVLARSEPAMLVVQVAGGLYLLWLAFLSARALVGMLRAPVRVEGATVHGQSRGAFTKGLISNLTNAKVMVFYLSFFPQFIGRARSSFAQLELLALVFLTLAAIYQVSVVLLAGRFQHLMRRRWFAIALEALSVLVFVGIAVVILVEAAL